LMAFNCRLPTENDLSTCPMVELTMEINHESLLNAIMMRIMEQE